MKRAIAFTRVSTGRQDEGERQLIQIRKYCNEKGYELSERIISESISGKSDKRQGLVELEELTKEDADIVIVSEASRLTRKDENDFLDLYLVVKTVQKTGLDLYFVGSGQEYQADKKLTLIDVITLVIEADRNAKERETLIMRTKTGKEKIALKGGFTGHKVAYGFKIEKVLQENGKLQGIYTLNEPEAKLMKQMFDLIGKQGYTVGQLTKYLNRTQDKKWIHTVLAKMLHNPIYKGELSIHNTIIKLPAIVTPEEFDEVQLRIKANHLELNKGNKRFNQLKGLAKCACGCSFYLNATGYRPDTNKSYVHYKCMSKNHGTYKESCTNSGIDESFLNAITFDIVKAYINIEDFKVQTAEQRKTIEQESKGIKRQLTTLESEKIELESMVTNATNILINTSNPAIIPTLEKALSDKLSQVEKVKKQIENLNKELTKLNRKLSDLADTLLPSLVENLSPEDKNQIFKKYIQKITYYSTTRNKGFVVIQFINGLESVIIIKTRPKFEAFQLPQSFSFNPETRKVITTTYESQSKQMFSIGSAITNELSYEEFVNQYNIEEFRLNSDFQNTIEEQYQAEYNQRLEDLSL
jgi:site-specific DNA recombinase